MTDFHLHGCEQPQPPRETTLHTETIRKPAYAFAGGFAGQRGWSLDKVLLSSCFLSVVVWFAGGEQSLMVGQGAKETLRQPIFAAVFCGVLNCTQTLFGGETARRPITKGLAINWRDVVSFGFWLAMVLQSTRDVTHLALVFHSLNFLIYIGQRFRQKNFKYQFIAKPGRCKQPHAVISEVKGCKTKMIVMKFKRLYIINDNSPPLLHFYTLTKTKPMKKITLVNLFCFLTAICHSQLTKGNWLVGGNARFATQQQKEDVLLGGSTFSVHIAPIVGYFFADKFATGLETNFSYTNVKVGQIKSKVTGIGVGPFVRYYFLSTDNRVNILAHSAYKHLWYSQNYNEKTFLLSAGPVFYFNSSVGLETTLNYQHFSNSATSISATTFFLGIGLQIHLENN